MAEMNPYFNQKLLERVYFRLLVPVDYRLERILRYMGASRGQESHITTKSQSIITEGVFGNTATFKDGWVPLEHFNEDPELNAPGFEKKRYLYLNEEHGIERRRIAIKIRTGKSKHREVNIWVYRFMQSTENWYFVYNELLKSNQLDINQESPYRMTLSIPTEPKDLKSKADARKRADIDDENSNKPTPKKEKKAKMYALPARLIFMQSDFTVKFGDIEYMRAIDAADKIKRLLINSPAVTLSTFNNVIQKGTPGIHKSKIMDQSLVIATTYKNRLNYLETIEKYLNSQQSAMNAAINKLKQASFMHTLLAEQPTKQNKPKRR